MNSGNTALPCTEHRLSKTAKKHWLGPIALGLALMAVGLQVSTWSVRLRYPGEWCGIEGMLLGEIQHLRQGIPIYARVATQRFDAAQYGPFYYLLGSRLIDPARPSYLALRLLSTLATLGCAAACGWLAFRTRRRRVAAALAPLIFLSNGLVSFFGLSLRPDSVALLLASVGVLVAYRFRESHKILVSAPVFLAALFYKQQFIAGPIAVLVYLVVERRHRLAAVFATLMTVGAASLAAIFQVVVFGGQDFLEHFYNYNLLPFSWVLFKGGVIVFGVLFLVPLLVAFEFLRVHSERFLACYLGSVVVITLLAAGKEGGDTNYFLEPIFVTSVLFASQLGEGIENPSSSSELLILLCVLLFLGRFAPPPPTSSDFPKDQELQDYLRQTFPAGTRALGYYTGDLIRAGLDAPVSDLYLYSQLVRKGTIMGDPLASALERQEIRVVVLTFDLSGGKDMECQKRYLTDRLAGAIRRHYQLLTTLEMPGPERHHLEDRSYVWVPRPQNDAAAMEGAQPR